MVERERVKRAVEENSSMNNATSVENGAYIQSLKQVTIYLSTSYRWQMVGIYVRL
jgi:hypothetical protein